MSDRQSKNYEEVKKAFFSRVSGRTRGKRDAYAEIAAETHGIGSTSKDIVREPKRRKEMKPAPSVGGQRKKSAKRSADMHTKLPEMERVDESEYLSDKMCSTSMIRGSTMQGSGKGFYAANSSKKPCASIEISLEDARHRRFLVQEGKNSADMDKNLPEMERVDESEFLRDKICSASKIRGSPMQGLNKGFCAANSSKKPCATVKIYPEDVRYRRYLVQEGNDNEEFDAEGIEIIDKAEFIGQISFSMSKIGSSSKEKLNEVSSAANFKKDAGNESKRETSAGCGESFCPKDACHASDHAWPHESNSFIQLESDSDDMLPKIQRVDEAELGNQKTCLKSKTGKSAKQGGARKNIFSSDHSISFALRDYSSDSDTLADDSITLAKKANNNEHRSFREIEKKGNDEGVLRKGKLPLTKNGYSAVSSRKKNTDFMKEVPFYKHCGLSSHHAGRDSRKEQDKKSRSSSARVNSDDNTDHEDFGIEKIDESEFRNTKRQFVKEIGSSTWQEPNEEHIAAISIKKARRVSEKISSTEKNGRNRKKMKTSDLTRKRKGKSWNKKVDDVGSSSNEFICSSSSTESNRDDVSTSLRDSEVSSYGEKQKTAVGIANQTRLKMGSIKKPAESGLSTDSDSSTDSEYDDSLDEDFVVESSDNDLELLGSHVEACEIQEENEEKDRSFHCDADAEEGLKERNNLNKYRCSKQFNTPKGRDKVKGVNELHPKDQSKAGTRRRKEVARRPSHSKDDNDHSGDGSKKSSEETISDLPVCAKTKTTDMINEMVSTGPKEAAPPSHSKDGYDHSGDGREERTEATTWHSHVRAKNETACMANEKEVPAGPKEATPSSHSKDLCDHTDYGTKERTGATSSGSDVRAKNRTAFMANEKKALTRLKKAAPPSQPKDVYGHTDNGTKERTGASSSSSDVRARNKTADMANQKKAPTRPKEAATPSQLKNVYDQTEDGAEERTGATSSGSRVRAENKSADMATEKNAPTRPEVAAPPFQPKDVYDQTEDGAEERTGATSSGSRVPAESMTVDMANEMEVPTRRKQVSSKKFKDLCSILADAVLGSGQMPEKKETYEETEQAPVSQTENTLPLKFRFEDEVPVQVEKTEYEKELDDLFCELDRELALDTLQSFDPEDKIENEKSPVEETQHARCSRGKHELVLEDDRGLICIFCHHVELGPKDVMPEWAERTYRDSEIKRYREMEQHLEFDELHSYPSTNDDADVGNSSDATGTVWSIKPGVRESMYEHQREGFEFLWRNLAGSINIDELRSTDELKSSDLVEVGGCIISHAPGTGKTRLTIVFVETYVKMFPKCMPVIISPASTLLTWEEEFKKWNVGFPFHNLSVTELSGKENKTALRLLPQTKFRDMESVRMMKICSWNMGGSILGISYNLFEKLTGERKIKEKTNKKRQASFDEKIRKILLEKPGLVVLDEGHTPRNQRSNIWNALLKLRTEKRVILSGTPFQNNFHELFNTLRIVRPAKADMLAQEKTFAEMAAPRRKYKGECSQSSFISEAVDRTVENLKSCISPFVHLHKGTILQQSLPGLRDCVVLLKPPTLQKSLIERLEGCSNFEFEHKVALISVHPYLFRHCGTTEDGKVGIDMGAIEASKLNPQEGVKTRFLLELVRLSVAVKEKVLVFSQYIHPLELIKEQLKEVFNWVEGRQILHLQGKQYQKQRQLLINLFNDPQSESKIMLASTRCCAEGISLIGASRVVLLDVVWNPSVERQAICRAYRIGQKKFVHTYHLMTSGTTEADKYCRQAEKERLSELVFSSSNESNQEKHPSLSIEDRILEVMVNHDSLKGMFEKIINQPKEKNLIQTFSLTS